jgi:hypothetical protein
MVRMRPVVEGEVSDESQVPSELRGALHNIYRATPFIEQVTWLHTLLRAEDPSYGERIENKLKRTTIREEMAHMVSHVRSGNGN